jgi:hypothetical protein
MERIPPHFHKDDRISAKDIIPDDRVYTALPESGQEGERIVVEDPADTFTFYQYVKGDWRQI